MHQALYRKYRPSTFDDVVGQEHITSVLTWEVANNKVNHAYVFCGSAGTGKTSCAKILAKAVNCENPINGNPCNCCYSCKQIDAGASVEVLEMDAASNTGVDYIRDIRDEVIFTPSEMGTKVYIIDEVHMLSEGAFNALLKTLEEPPKSVIFILATTEIQDIPATILSRCQRFDFKRLSTHDIVRRLEYIASQESLTLQKEAAVLIAHLAQGGMRDAVSLFELCIDRDGKVTEENVRSAAGIVGRETVIETVRAVAENKTDRMFEILSEIYRSSKDISVFVSDLIMFYRDMLVQKVMRINSLDGLNRDILDVSSQELSDIQTLAALFTREKIVYHIKLLEDAYITMNKSDIKRVTAEITLMRMALNKTDSSLEGLEARLAELELKVANGVTVLQTSSLDSASTVKKDTSSVEKKKSEPINTSRTDVISTQHVNGQEDRVLSEWVDILDDYSAKNPSRSPFLQNSSAVLKVTDNKLVIQVSDAFSKMMLDNAQAGVALLQIAAKYGIRADGTEFLVAPKPPMAKDPMQDLI